MTAMRTLSWRWVVSSLLLLATLLNYMDRQVFSSSAVDIQAELHLDDRHYGELESAFSLSFGLGSLIFGWMADRTPVRWLYAAVVIFWSGAGVATSWAGSFAALIACRAWLGFAEAGHWPCGLRTTRDILPARDRPLGNGLLQSGAALGGILTPLVIQALAGAGESARGWRPPFLVIGCAGIVWAVAWLVLSRRPAGEGRSPPPLPAAEISRAAAADSGEGELSLRAILLDRRLWILAALSGLFNATWQFLRAWLPKYMEELRGYDRAHTLAFTSYYFLAAGLGSLAAGWVARRLAQGGMAVARARALVMVACALLSALGSVVVLLPRGPGLQAVLLLMGFGSLGIFPGFYSLTQEISGRHQGKVTAVMGLSCWLLVARLQPLTGSLIDSLGRSRGYAWNLVIGGFLPLAGMGLLGLFWPREARKAREAGAPATPAGIER
jgi:ACS family hexuronate transporter-like MFS transporter